MSNKILSDFRQWCSFPVSRKSGKGIVEGIGWNCWYPGPCYCFQIVVREIGDVTLRFVLRTGKKGEEMCGHEGWRRDGTTMMQGIQNLLTAPRFPSDTRQNSMPRALFTSSFRLFFFIKLDSLWDGKLASPETSCDSCRKQWTIKGTFCIHTVSVSMLTNFESLRGRQLVYYYYYFYYYYYYYTIFIFLEK